MLTTHFSDHNKRFYRHICKALVIALMGLLSACGSPEKAIEKRQYKRAMNLACDKIAAQKDVENNLDYLYAATDSLNDMTLRAYQSIDPNDINQLKHSQSQFNKNLKHMLRINKRLNEVINKEYNKLCEVKHTLDLEVVDYYYKEADHLLSTSLSSGKTEYAREAYPLFIKSQREGAEKFYGDLDTKKALCIEYGTIYVDAPYKLNINNRFVKRISSKTNKIPDCVVKIQTGFFQFNESSSIKTNTIQETVKTGEEAIRDTTGIVLRYEDITTTVYAYEQVKTIEYTASQSLDIIVKANTDECFLSSQHLNFSESESCTELRYTGDDRALSGKSDSDCSTTNFRSHLERLIESRIDDNCYIR